MFYLKRINVVKIQPHLLQISQGTLTDIEGSVALTSLNELVDQRLFIMKVLFTFVPKQAT
jgi:hypothetical protein